ncbi:bile acid-coenzyme A ligase [Tamaricihabitans halophyticus]|uniref:Bile acid-coenzyme A ligase n=1 Tax=Tamaricihabitans halophyticus TaxID=1262583 RepID=A0A4R2R218_9PSEU|nr:AMP-binding protein [Tamaricihabitans halophyticus]TCP53465.1 bile acid-coenzyme A ligase [Tamaricihabitans halophyticus]
MSADPSAPPGLSELHGDAAAEPQSIGRIIAALAAQAPDRPSLSCAGVSITRHQLEHQSNRLARAYAELGVGVGDFVSIALPNSIEFYLAAVATWKLGAVPQPLSYRLPIPERQAIVELAEPRLIVGVDQTVHPDRTCVPKGFSPDAGLSSEPLPDAVSPAWKAPTSGGSTGRPKLIVAGQPGTFPPVPGAAFGITSGGVQLVTGPLYHSSPFGMSSLGLFSGQHLVVLPKFDPVAALDAITTYQVTWLNLVPTMMVRMLRAIEAEPERFDLATLDVVWHMAAPCPAWVKEAWIDLLGPDKVLEMYGGSENQALTVITGTEWLAHRGSVGKAVLGEIAVFDVDGKPAPAGELGEIFMRSAEPMYRYVGAEVRRVNGWESIGDLGWMDDDGYLYLSDRRTDLIISGGANIYPAEIEAVLSAHPKVDSCAVVGLPDDDLGQRVHALVEVSSEAAEDEILGYVAERLVRYKVPRMVEFVDTPLRDDAGKLRRSALRDAAVERMRRKAMNSRHEFMSDQWLMVLRTLFEERAGDTTEVLGTGSITLAEHFTDAPTPSGEDGWYVTVRNGAVVEFRRGESPVEADFTQRGRFADAARLAETPSAESADAVALEREVRPGVDLHALAAVGEIFADVHDEMARRTTHHASRNDSQEDK